MIRSVFKVLLLAMMISWRNEIAAEIRKLLPKCPNSCLGNGDTPPTNCYCDSKCSLVYNDCCLDAPYRAIRVTSRRNRNMNCVFVHGENSHFWMVDSCKDSWQGREQIREKCTGDGIVSGESNDIIGSVPVTNPSEEVTYKNYYCSRCNDEEPDDLVEWQVKALCNDPLVTQSDILQNLTFAEDRQQWGVWKLRKQKWVFHKCVLLFQKPPNATSGIRRCVSGMISSCPRAWNNISTRRLCRSYVDPVKWTDGIVFRNMDCAFCHNRTGDRFQCVYDVTKGSSAIMLNRAMNVDLWL